MAAHRIVAAIGHLITAGLTPIPFFKRLGLPYSGFDVIGSLRLALVLRQLRDMEREKAQKQRLSELKRRSITSVTDLYRRELEEPYIVKDIIAILVVIYGGELICCSWLQFTPSFLLYPAYPIIFALAQVFINALPSTIIPPMSIHTELPLSLFDALTRSWLLTTGNPAFIVGHAREDVRGSPFALVVASLVLANGGFFLINFFQMLSPYGYHVRTPPEFRTAGWTTMDLWIAPLITALYAILTHTQPFWVPIHTIFIKQVSRKTLLFGRVLLVSDMVENDEGEWSEILKEYVKPMGKEEARSVLAILVCLLFAYRAIVNFGLEWVRMKRKKMIKTRNDLKRRSRDEVKLELKTPSEVNEKRDTL